MTYLFPILLLAMSAYVLYGAIAGKGKLFSLENIKDECKDKIRKYLRILYAALGVIVLLMAVVNFGQSVLYSNAIVEYEATDAYKTEFADVITDGTVEYGGMTYRVEGKHTVEEMDAILRAAMSAHPDKFQTQQSAMSCLGGGASANVQNYYSASPVLDENGNAVYVSTIGSVRSDANDGSFLSKLYRAISSKAMSILSYVFMGLAVLCVVAIFVLINKFTDKEKLAKARAQQTGASMPSGAFRFDEEDK